MDACECGANFSRKSNLQRHKRDSCWKHIGVKQDIPTFDGAEFGTDKPKSRETMEKI